MEHLSNRFGLGSTMEQAIEHEMKMQREIDRAVEDQRMARETREQREVERAYAAARQAALLEQYASNVGPLGIPNKFSVLYDRALGLGNDFPPSVAMLAAQMAEVDAVTKARREVMAAITPDWQRGLYGVRSAITGLHTPTTVDDAIATFTRDLEQSTSGFGAALAGIDDPSRRFRSLIDGIGEDERIRSIMDSLTSRHEPEWFMPEPPSLPPIQPIAEQVGEIVEDVTRRVVREELERLTAPSVRDDDTESDESLYGGDGVKRTPGFLADDHDE